MIFCGILGVAYYVTADRIYESFASLYIVRLGATVNQDTPASNSSPANEMPTFIALMSEEEVILRALQILPEKYRDSDLGGVEPRWWAATVQSRLSASADFNTNVLDISYRSRDPRAAAAMLTAMLAGYEHFLNETNRGLSEQGLQTLQARLLTIEGELNELTDERLQLKQSAPELVDTGDGSGSLNVISRNIEQLTMDYSKAQKDTEQAQTTIQELRRAIENGEDILQFAMETLDSAGRQLIEQSMGLGTQDSFHIQRITQELLNLQSQLNEQRQRYGVRHPRIQSLETEIAVKEQYLLQFPDMQRRKTEEMTRTVLAPRLVQYLNQHVQKAEQNQQAILTRLVEEQGKAQRISQTLTRLDDLDRKIDALYQQQASLQAHADGIGLNKDTFLSTRVASRPTVPLKPVSPRLPIIAVLSMMMGVTLGLAAIWVLDIMDDRFRTPEELKLQLETQVLAMIPRLRELAGTGFEAVMCHKQPNSRDVEAFRALRTSVDFSPLESNRMVVTSTEPGDGKTTVSSNLSVAFAQSGKRTLVIDADMRRPGLSTLLGLRDDAGLSRILRSDEELDQSIQANLRPTEVEQLDVISCGPRPTNPAELLSSERFAALLSWAETRYQQIVIDAPPVLAVSDPAIVGRLVDSVVLVVRPDKDRRRMVIRAAETLRTLGCSLLGVVVNHLSTSEAGGYG
ncbi:MAG: polysaccharide biosynthesis tyrosine autokinase, partial [Planctomycetaceae bacterium]